MQSSARCCAFATILLIAAAAPPRAALAQEREAGRTSPQTAPIDPTLPGQDAFGAIQEIVQILETDPQTDWSKVNLEALRQHLIDMNEVTLNARTSVKLIDGGLEIAVTGDGRTIAAIQRVVPAHARAIEKTHPYGWSAKAPTLPDGVLLKVTSSHPKETQHIRGLGFIGIMVSGHRHQLHHLALARGEKPHENMLGAAPPIPATR